MNQTKLNDDLKTKSRVIQGTQTRFVENVIIDISLTVLNAILSSRSSSSHCTESS